MRKRIVSISLATLACALLLGSLGLPLWQMKLEAPQYQDEEALEVKVFPGSMKGDLGELEVLNSYIGVTMPKTLPQLQWLPMALWGAGILGVAAACLPAASRRWALFLVPLALFIALLVAAAQAQWQMHRIGHERAAKTTLVGVKNFTPPLLGRSKVAQFTITSTFSWGALLIGLGMGLQFYVAWLNRPPRKATARPSVADQSHPLDEGWAADTPGL